MAKKFEKVFDESSEKIEYYTDRKKASFIETINKIREVENNIENNDDNDYCLINIYGIGGEGKSFYLKKIINILNEENYKYIKYDAARECNESYSMLNTLIRLRNLLVDKYNYNFNEFDIMIMVIDKSLQNSLTPYKKNTGTTVVKNIAYDIFLTTIDVFSLGYGSVAIDGAKNLKEDMYEKMKEVKLKN